MGQGYLIATPVQLAKYAYILANKGAHKDLSLTFDSTKDLKEPNYETYHRMTGLTYMSPW